ncbi:MAG: cbb3-type cytochrome c oxidase subunit I [Gemmatimonadaceae bacterium]|nr:cbb3-type cytochrome c oxidase subunit I [Gemmatimonadaceae bacterium]
MDWFSRLFLKSALVSLGLGIVMGTWMALVPGAIIYRPAHVHLNLLGFVSMVIFGVAYHVIPRFTGHPLHSPRMAGVHWWSANVGLVLLVGGFLCAPHVPAASRVVLGIGALFAATGSFLFIYNLWRTIDGTGPKPRQNSGSGRALPVSG